ncbi:hypothetical protein Agub_g11659, partial [Astrephomene gubernaculifera]
MSDRSFSSLRDSAIARAEAGDFPSAVRLFRRALLQAAQQATAAHPADGPDTAASSNPDAASRPAAATSSFPSSPSPSPSSAVRQQQVAAVHDMLAQCLMELGAEAEWEGEGGGAEVEACVEGGEGSLWQDALMHAGEAVSLRPQWVPGLLTYGRCLRNCGLLDEALRALRAAEQLLEAQRSGGSSSRSSSRSGAGALACGPCSCRRAAPAGQPSPDEAGGSSGQPPQRPAVQATPPDFERNHGQEEEEEEYGSPDAAELVADVARELEEVSELWQQQLARDVGLPGLRIRQDAGHAGGGPGRRVWECGIQLAAHLVRWSAAERAAGQVGASGASGESECGSRDSVGRGGGSAGGCTLGGGG